MFRIIVEKTCELFDKDVLILFNMSLLSKICSFLRNQATKNDLSFHGIHSFLKLGYQNHNHREHYCLALPLKSAFIFRESLHSS